MKIKVTFTEPMLGTLAGKKETATEWIAGKHKDGAQEDEMAVIESLDEALTNGSTVIPKDEKGYFLWDYQIKGFFKSSILAAILSDSFTQESLKKIGLSKYTYKRVVDLQLFVNPRKVYLTMPSDTTFVERPLRADTMRGERIALARSEAAPAGTTFEADIVTMQKSLNGIIEWCLDYGRLSGIGQWRNSGMGRFEWEHAE